MTTRKILIGLGAASVLVAGIAAYGGASAQTYSMMGGFGPGYGHHDSSVYARTRGDMPAYGRMHGWSGHGPGMMGGYGPGMMYGYGYDRGMMGW